MKTKHHDNRFRLFFEVQFFFKVVQKKVVFSFFFIKIMDDPNDDGIISSQNELFPEPTAWEHICICCSLEYSYVPALKKRFINSWEVSCGMPNLVLFIILSSYCIFIGISGKLLPYLNLQLILFVTTLMFLFIASYIVGILEGPGYLPYYYPYRLEERKDGKKDNLSGLVTTKEQLMFISKNPPLHRAGFFKSAHRIVLRPDHYCDWFETFIGKKNHKLFFLFNFWGMLYIAMFLIFDIATIVQITKDVKNILFIPFLAIYIILGLTFFILTFTFTIVSLKNITMNQTQFEEMRSNSKKVKYSRPRVSCIEAWEEVFGSRSKWYLWPFPIPAFHNIDEYDLVNKKYGEKIL